MAEFKATKIRLRDGSRCVIRSAYDRDAPELLDYYNAVGGESPYLEFGEDEYGHSEAEQLHIIRVLFATKTSLLLVAEVSEEIVGTLSLYGSNAVGLKHHAWLGINVARDYWGLGLGRSLLETVLGWAGAHRTLRKLSLFVRHDNRRAIELYTKLGFVVEGRLAGMLHADGVDHDTLCMSRAVS